MTLSPTNIEIAMGLLSVSRGFQALWFSQKEKDGWSGKWFHGS